MKKALQIGQAFLRLSDPEEGDVITNLKLQKLLYYAQGFHLALYNSPLFEEDILRWNHGPVVREVYNRYKSLGAKPLPIPTTIVTLSEKEKKLIEDVWKVFGQFSAWRLREMTHMEDPWKDTPRDEVITKTKLKTYFKSQLV